MAEEQDKSQRTEPATPKKRQEARQKGQVAQSRELQNVAVMLAGLLAFASPLGGALVQRIVLTMRASFQAVANPPGTLADFEALMLGFTIPVAMAALPIMLILAAIGGGTQIAQTGPLFAPEALAPKLQRISLIAGMGRLFNKDKIFELIKALLKVAFVMAIGWFAVRGDIAQLVGLTGASPMETAIQTGLTSRRLAFAILFLLGLIAAIDVFYQRSRYEENLKMTRKDVRDELKQAEGDPLMRGRYRQRHRDLTRTRMIAAVADADVVVTNPTHYAVALKYDRESMAAPNVVAKGKDHVAARIRAVAEAHRVPIVENPPLARLLHKTVGVDQEVPTKLFQAVAEVLAYVYRLDRRKARAWSASS